MARCIPIVVLGLASLLLVPFMTEFGQESRALGQLTDLTGNARYTASWHQDIPPLLWARRVRTTSPYSALQMRMAHASEK